MTSTQPHTTEATGLTMDPVRFEVMRHAFGAAADEMAAALRKAAYSTNIKTRADFSCALYDANVRVIAQSFSQPIHLASMSRMVPAALKSYGTENLEPGDALAFNHPHMGAMHLNDVALIAPIFHDDGLAGYAAAVAHHVDIGGMAPGGLSISRDLYQEGIIIPPTKLVRGGRIVDEVFNLIIANIRAPKQSAGDLRAQTAAVILGQRRMGEIIERFSRPAIDRFTDELIDYTERWTRRVIRAMPEGTYRAEGELDDDGVTDKPIRLVVQATIKEGRVLFDLTGCDPQRPSPMNANLTYAYSALSYVVKCLLGADVPTNAGFYACIDVTAPEGTVVNAQPPVGVVGGAEVAIRLCDLGFKAFSQAMPDRVVACSKSVICQMGVGGADPETGAYYTFMETLAGGYGGRPNKDGLDAVQAHIQNTENSAIEETENNYPILITRYELIPDSEGAGRYRGGLGVRRDWRFVDHEATFTVFSDNRRNAPWGLFGGESGRSATYMLDPEGEAKELPSKITLTLAPNATISYRTPGGGGYGSPLERDPQAVLNDVINGKVTPQRAEAVYGVAINIETRQVDQPATQRLRQALTTEKERQP